MSTELCGAWILRGLNEGEWFPEDVYCQLLVMHEPCPTLLVWLQKTWSKQGFFFKLVYASELDGSDIAVLLGMSFIESTSMMMIVMDIDPSRKIYQRIMDYFLQYTGPYRILLVTLSHKNMPLSAQKYSIIELPKQVDYSLFTVLYQLMHQCAVNSAQLKVFFDHVGRLTNKLTMPHACLLMPYIDLIGKGREYFFNHWMGNLLQSTPSLFTLSQHLLMRNVRAFYSTWSWIRNRYADEFWAVYWSDQLWQAHCFIVAMHKGGQEEASGFSRGLPFAFMQRGWRSYDAELFIDTLELLYHYDCQAKQGGLEIPYELLFQKIFMMSPMHNG